MSYIDQDTLLERIDGIYDCNDMRFEPNDKCCTVPDDCKGCKWAETKRAIRKIVENMPAADVRPVVRGEWGKKLNPSFSPFDDSGAYLYRCNQCGHIQNYESNFCPNCGADMREES